MMTSLDVTIPTKRCTKCGEEFPASKEFFMLHKGKLYSQCHTCRREAKRQSHVRNRDHNNQNSRKYAQEHAEQNRERSNQWYWENIEAAREQHRDYSRANAEVGRARVRKWRKQHPDANRDWRNANPEAVQAIHATRRARKRAASGSYTANDVGLQIKAQTDAKGVLHCWWCSKSLGDDYHVDHRIALARGGNNDAGNICISCAFCNLSKHDKLPHEWNGRLL